MKTKAGRSDFYLTNEELQEILGCSASRASVVTVALNKELEEKGMMTIGGKIPVEYFAQRFGFNLNRLLDKFGKYKQPIIDQ